MSKELRHSYVVKVIENISIANTRALSFRAMGVGIRFAAQNIAHCNWDKHIRFSHNHDIRFSLPAPDIKNCFLSGIPIELSPVVWIGPW